MANDRPSEQTTAGALVDSLRQLTSDNAIHPEIRRRVSESLRLAQSLQTDLGEFSSGGSAALDDDSAGASREESRPMPPISATQIATLNMAVGYVDSGRGQPLYLHLERFDDWYSAVAKSVREINHRVKCGMPFLGHGDAIHPVPKFGAEGLLDEFGEAVGLATENRLTVTALSPEMIGALHDISSQGRH